MKTPIYTAVLILTSLSLFALSTQISSAKDICAGQLFNNNDEAQQECPAVCGSEAPIFNGNWTNAHKNVALAGCRAGEESVCGSNIGDICADQLFNDNDEAQQKCPEIVTQGRVIPTFNGAWTNAHENVALAGCKEGEESVCGSNIGDICAGVAFFSNDEAQQKCPAIVEQSSSTSSFNGNWTNQAENVALAGCQVGEESVCGCG